MLYHYFISYQICMELLSTYCFAKVLNEIGFVECRCLSCFLVTHSLVHCLSGQLEPLENEIFKRFFLKKSWTFDI